MATAGPMVADLRAESDELDALVADLSAERAGPSRRPAPGWTIAHQIAHLLWTDRVALTAVTDEAGFAARAGRRRPRTRPDSSTRAPRSWPRPARPTARRLAPDPGPAARRTAGRRRRPQAAVVRPADERRRRWPPPG